MHLRAEYRVGQELKFLANLDMMHLMERALRRAEIPYLLSEGFNPHIRLSMGTVLPVGLWGEKEYFDLELQAMPPEEFRRRMNQSLPSGMEIHWVQELPPGTPSLMKVVNAAEYAFMIRPAGLDLGLIIAQIMAQPELWVQSRGKNKQIQKDLRPGIYGVELQSEAETEIINCKVSVNEPVNVRFDELLEVLVSCGVAVELILDFWRRGNYIKQGDKFYSPLEVLPKGYPGR
ncbi:MAG: TIGR03936 family radical SAM-associated protein [Firmicutes bacterium]|nr:TIGR03936 family radical SAM-associated protein [Bacillota bacterium]